MCKGIIEQLNLSLYDLEYVDDKSTLRLYIQNPLTDTATIEECSSVDRALTDVIESADFIPDNFVLEVSSPGVFRNLRSESHFAKAVDKRVALFFRKKMSFNVGIKDAKRVFGTMKEASNSTITLVEEETGRDIEIKFEELKKANIEPHWDDIKDNS